VPSFKLELKVSGFQSHLISPRGFRMAAGGWIWRARPVTDASDWIRRRNWNRRMLYLRWDLARPGGTTPACDCFHGKTIVDRAIAQHFSLKTRLAKKATNDIFHALLKNLCQ